MEANYYHEMTNCIDKMIIQSKLKNKHIFLFGHCEASEQMLIYLEAKGYAVTGILDNNVNKHGTSIRGVTVYAATYVVEYKSDETIVLIASRAFEAMKSTLLQRAYKGEIIKVVDYNTFAEYSLSQETYEKKYERVQRGINTLNKLKATAQGKFLFICPYNALGDVYYAMAYLPHYLQKMQIDEYAIAVVGKGCQRVVQMFTRQESYVLTTAMMDEVVQAVIYLEDNSVLIVHHDRPYTNDMTPFIDGNNISFCEMYCCGIYGLPKGTAATKPLYCKEYQNIDLLKKGKSIIISPYAKSIVGISEKFWKDIIEKYKQNGFFIYTNVVGDEKALANTIPITIPLEEMISAVEYAGYFVGIRSGLCDIITTAYCEKTVVFPDVYYSMTQTKVDDFFKLEGWKSITVNFNVIE